MNVNRMACHLSVLLLSSSCMPPSTQSASVTSGGAHVMHAAAAQIPSSQEALRGNPKSNASGPQLADLIPQDAWKRTGIEKLTVEERTALAAEIGRLFQRLRSSGVAVIAPSVSTSLKAREIMARSGVVESRLRYAARVLVVVRSALYNPLAYSYDSFGKLTQDAENQLNIAGPKYHVYVYDLDDDLRATKASHQSFEARD